MKILILRTFACFLLCLVLPTTEGKQKSSIGNALAWQYMFYIRPVLEKTISSKILATNLVGRMLKAPLLVPWTSFPWYYLLELIKFEELYIYWTYSIIFSFLVLTFI